MIVSSCRMFRDAQLPAGAWPIGLIGKRVARQERSHAQNHAV